MIINDLQITLIQSDLHWENCHANLTMFSEKIEQLNEPSDLIVLPEMFSTGFSMKPEMFAETMDGAAINWMKETAAKKKCVICGSLMMNDSSKQSSGTKYYNRLIWMRADGTFECYDKHHLFGLGEEHNHFSAGTKKIIVELKGWKILPLVCYDLRFPVWSRNKFTADRKNSAHSTAEYDILIYVANWPERRINAWKTLLEARAIENQSYVIGVNRVGNDGNGHSHPGESSVIDPKGDLLWREKNIECTSTCALSYQALNHVRESLPFLKDVDEFDFK